MGGGWVVMLDTLRRIDALLDRMSFLGVSAGNRTQNENTTKNIETAMNTLIQKGVKQEHKEVDECQVHYSYKGFTIIVYWNGVNEYICDINNHFGEEMHSSSEASITKLVAWIQKTLNIK